MSTNTSEDFIDLKTPAEWRKWLEKHHKTDNEVWLRIAKKNSGETSITIPEALDIALCYGWIDSHRRGFDNTYYLQRYSPRTAKSPWSLINIRKAEALIEAGLMQPAGFAAIDAAKADGRWTKAFES